jgi:AraC-like DNA-binding protein
LSRRTRTKNPLLARLALGPVLANVFQELRLSATLTDGRTWLPVYGSPNVVSIEFAHRVEGRRDPHNARSLARARRTGRPVLAQHAGFHDLFAPVGLGSQTVLAVGPFAVARPSSLELQSRWRWLTGTNARAGDPEFAHYLELTLATATFEGPMLDALVRFVETFCRLLSGQGDSKALEQTGAALRKKLSVVRLVERSFEAAADLVDERTSRSWTSPHWVDHLRFLRAERVPSHAIVGLIAGARDELDPIDQLLRCDAWQRAAVDLAFEIGGVVTGKVGDRGVTLLVDHPSKGARLQRRLVDVAERARVIARRFGLRAHMGISNAEADLTLPQRYEAALEAAEKALTGGESIGIARRAPRRVLSQLGELRRELARAVGATPGVLGPRFDRYLEAVTLRCGYRLEPLRAHVEAGFDQIVEALRLAGAIDESSLMDLREPLERAADAKTVPDLLLAYRRAVLDVQEAVLHPKQAHHDRSVRRATAFVRGHLDEPLPLARVARVAGFAPTYFSSIFAKTEKTTLGRYIRRLRVERAKRMLDSTVLAVERVGQLCGFRTRTSFHQAFQELVRVTPGEYRERSRSLAKIAT